MPKNKRKQPTIEEILERPWCYYCERDFDDLKILINHQKAKHMKCSLCPRRLNTAGGLGVHMEQVHKEDLRMIENTIEGRQDPKVEIFGMEGIPDNVRAAYDVRKTQEYYAEQADHRQRSGNGTMGAVKKVKHETPEELKKRLAEHKARKAAGGDLDLGSGPGTPIAKVGSPSVKTEVPSEVPTFDSPANIYPPPFSQAQAASPPAAFPPFGAPPPNGMPYAPPYAAPPIGFGGPPPSMQGMPYPGFAGTPPQAQPFSYGPSPGPPFGGPPPQMFSGLPHPPITHHRPPPVQHEQKPVSKSPTTNGMPPRQNSLPSVAGLPPRPSFDAPPVTRAQLNEMHAGQKPLSEHNEASAISSGVDDLIAEAQTQANGTPTASAAIPVPEIVTPGLPMTPVNGHAIPAKDKGGDTSMTDRVSVNGTPTVDAISPAPPTPAVTTPKPTKPSKSSHAKGDKTKKRTVLVIKDESRTPEEKMASMSRYSFTEKARLPSKARA